MTTRNAFLARCRFVFAATAVAGMLAAFVAAAPAAAAGDGPYGAIAVNTSTGSAGVSYGAYGLRSAKSQALGHCPGACQLAVWVRNQCAAVVHYPGWFIPGVGRTKAAAIRNARYRAHHRGTRLVAWTCSVTY